MLGAVTLIPLIGVEKMPKFHVELDCRSVETYIFVVEARDLEEAIESAMRWDNSPVETKTFPSDEMEVDYDNSFEIVTKPSESRDRLTR